METRTRWKTARDFLAEAEAEAQAARLGEEESSAQRLTTSLNEEQENKGGDADVSWIRVGVLPHGRHICRVGMIGIRIRI